MATVEKNEPSGPCLQNNYLSCYTLETEAQNNFSARFMTQSYKRQTTYINYHQAKLISC